MNPTDLPPDISTQLATGFATALINMVAAMLVPAIGYLAGVSLMVTQGIKSALLYFYKPPPAEMIWFAIGPVGTAPFAWLMWNTTGIHWLAAGCSASLLANLFYALVLKRIIGKVSPDVYEKINVPYRTKKTEATYNRRGADRR